MWFLQLESCNSASANQHGCVGPSGLHDICPADDLAELMAGGWLVSRENGRSVSQIEASARIRQIGDESGNLEINPDFGKLARVLENRPESPGVKARMAVKAVGDYASRQFDSISLMRDSIPGKAGTP